MHYEETSNMKNLSNILRRSNITPFERVMALVHDDVHREKTGKGILSESDVYALTKGWYGSASEVTEYNKYINIARLESSMYMDAQMFLYRAEVSILRNQRVLDTFLPRARMINDLTDHPFAKDIPFEESVRFLTQHTHLGYEKVLHIYTFHKLPREIQDDLLLLDEEIASDEKYLRDQVFLYERFGDGDILSKQNKDLIITNMYSRMYYEGVKKIKNSTAEKDGFLLHPFFAELQIKDLLQKLVDDEHIASDKTDAGTEEGLLSLVEECARNKNMSIERLVKEKLSRWLDDGLFVNEYSPLFMSGQFDTWNGDTKKNHAELFAVWYTELQKSKQYFQVLFDSKKLEKGVLEKEFLGMTRTTEIITGISLYACKEDADFVKEYKKQIESLLPIANVFLFIKKYAAPTKNYRTLREFKKLAQKVSSMFDIDMTEKYTEFINSYQEEVTFLNLSSSRLADMATGHLYLQESLRYIIDIDEHCFTFDLEEEGDVVNIVQKYSDEFKKLGVKTDTTDTVD